MRIKEDFVTNSSTTSFIVWGVSNDLHELKKNKKIMDMIYDKYVSEENGEILPREEYFAELHEEDEWSFRDQLERIFSKYGLESIVAPYDSIIFIGMDPFSIGDNETGLEFKMRVKNALDELDISGEPGRIEEAWMDG